MPNKKQKTAKNFLVVLFLLASFLGVKSARAASSPPVCSQGTFNPATNKCEGTTVTNPAPTPITTMSFLNVSGLGSGYTSGCAADGCYDLSQKSWYNIMYTKNGVISSTGAVLYGYVSKDNDFGGTSVMCQKAAIQAYSGTSCPYSAGGLYGYLAPASGSPAYVNRTVNVCLLGTMTSKNVCTYNQPFSIDPTCASGTFDPVSHMCITMIDNAAFVSYANLPTTVTPGQTFTATITMNNDGDTTWDPAANYKLGSQNLQDNSTWGLSRILLPAAVAPGANGTFTATFTAPTTPGTYNFQWQMLIEGVKWYGAQSTNQTIAVTAPAPVNGICGTDNGQTVASLLGTDPNLCSVGSISVFAGAGPWTWSCLGSNGGTDAPCAANKTCVPNNSGCAANTCTGSQCNDGCNIQNGTKTDGVCCISNGCESSTCSGSTCNNGCSASAAGTKTCNTLVPSGWKEVAP